MSRLSRYHTASTVAETLDRLITLEPPQNGGRGPASRGVTPDGVARLYGTARRRIGGPLADGAAAALLRRTRPGDRLVFTTGLVAPGVPQGETDSPAGAVDGITRGAHPHWTAMVGMLGAVVGPQP